MHTKFSIKQMVMAMNTKQISMINKYTLRIKPLFNLLLITSLHLLVSINVIARTTEIYPSMSDSTINLLLDEAIPGDTLFFNPGTYKGPFILNEVNGSVNLPIVIMGIYKKSEGSTFIDGQSEPESNLNNQAFFLSNSSWINIENFNIKNCWTDIIKLEDASYLSVKNCQLFGGKRAVFATGRGSHHILIENCTWEQEERVWTMEGDFNWDEIHHGIHKHYNGSLFQGSGISGVFVLRDNNIKNTFNAFRLSQINDGTDDKLACSNGEIYRNTIVNTSDNVLEPEVNALNLHFYHNQMINGHAFISITEVGGGNIYIYGNTAVSLPESKDGWTIFKISKRRKALTSPLYIFNNSWQVDFDIIGSPRNIWADDHVKHFNNAIFMEVSDTMGIYNIGEDNFFDHDCSNLPFPSLLRKLGLERNGIVGDPLFENAYRNDFRLKEASPCIDKGMISEDLILNYHGSSPDIGAYDNNELVEGIPFRYMDPGVDIPFEEHPRISRSRLKGNEFCIWFSIPLDKNSVSDVNFNLQAGDKIISLTEMELSADNYKLSFKTPNDISNKNIELLLSKWITGENGLSLTSWASEIPVQIQ